MPSKAWPANEVSLCLQEHLFLVCELLRANLYEFQKYNLDSGAPPWFTLPRVQAIAAQVLRALAFLHSLDLIHAGGPLVQAVPAADAALAYQWLR